MYGSFGDHIAHVPITEKDGELADYLYINDLAGLLVCVQINTIEFHGWGARAADVEHPDRMIFDLAPDQGLDFAQVKRAAIDILDRLADLGLASFALLSGGKGLHVVVPLTPGHDLDTHKDFAHRIAEAIAQAEPNRFTAAMSKARRKGHIFIHWPRNQRASTGVLPYSARARAGAPEAVPIAWYELDAMADAHPFTIDDAKHLIERARAEALKDLGLPNKRYP